MLLLYFWLRHQRRRQSSKRGWSRDRIKSDATADPYQHHSLISFPSTSPVLEFEFVSWEWQSFKGFPTQLISNYLLLPLLCGRLPVFKEGRGVEGGRGLYENIPLRVAPARKSYIKFKSTYNALVRLLSSVATHMHDKHVLGFEGSGAAHTVPPVAHKTLLVSSDVLVAYMLPRQREIKESD